MTDIVLGLGCDRGTPLATVREVIDSALHRLELDFSNVVALATIDKKSDEVAFLQLAQMKSLPLHLYTAAQLSRVSVPSPSETVRKYMGTPAVAEAAALLSANTTQCDLLLEKLKHKGADGKHATVSVAKVNNT